MSDGILLLKKRFRPKEGEDDITLNVSLQQVNAEEVLSLHKQQIKTEV